MYCHRKWCHLLVWHTSATVSCGPTYKGRVCAQMMRMRKSCCWFGIVGARWIDVHPIADLKFTKSRLASRFIALNCRLATLFYFSLHSSTSNSSSPPLPLLLYVALNWLPQRVWIHTRIGLTFVAMKTNVSIQVFLKQWHCYGAHVSWDQISRSS